jgi:hypothetical protein
MSDPSDAGHSQALRVLKLLLALALVGTVGVFGFARFGDPRAMPDSVYRLAHVLKNPRILPEVPIAWTRMCVAWNGWLGVLERKAPRLVQTEGLWAPDDPLRSALQELTVSSRQLHPFTLVPAAAGGDLELLALRPEPVVVAELQIPAVAARVAETSASLQRLAIRLEMWDRWKELRAMRDALATSGFRQVAYKLSTNLPPQPLSPGYTLNLSRTVKHLDDLALDRAGILPLAVHWSEYRRVAAELEKSDDPAIRRLPAVLLGRLADQPTPRDFAASLDAPIAEMRSALERTTQR